MRLFNGDCLSVLPILQNDSIDLCIADPPYAQTHNTWDVEIPTDNLWRELKRVMKPNGAIILFGQGMFTAKMMTSNPEMWRYNLIWDKRMTTGFLNANKMPLRKHEDIMVFYEKLPTYNPQKVKGEPNHNRLKPKNAGANYCECKNAPEDLSGMKHPTSIISIPKIHPSVARHPTEKPVELAEYLIKTYSNKGDTVLDFCMGCGSTGVACRRLGREFVGIELDEGYFEIAKERLL